jgi:2-amino-4-hydroxy-6-hydroxymethyldihydropteridine diphosphokinase
MARCLVSFGANIGDAKATIRSAADLIRQRLCNSQDDFRISRLFRTAPIGGPVGQPPFINAVAAITTSATVWDVWRCISDVEFQLGRIRNERWEARRIDLDVLLFEQMRIWTPHLKVPHPRMCMRRFILLPALDVAADWIDPVTGWTVQQLAENVQSEPGNFLLVADSAYKSAGLLAEVTQATGAQWKSSDDACDRRWVGLVEQRFSAHRDLNWWTEAGWEGRMRFAKRKLLVLLAPAMNASDAAWEDVSRSFALQLNLTEQDSNRIVSGPRYLLASDDRQWARQELVAALEAMDCPVEVILE